MAIPIPGVSHVAREGALWRPRIWILDAEQDVPILSVEPSAAYVINSTGRHDVTWEVDPDEEDAFRIPVTLVRGDNTLVVETDTPYSDRLVFTKYAHKVPTS
jgi:hypothetical protein